MERIHIILPLLILIFISNPIIYAQTQIPVISTRGNYDSDGNLNPNKKADDYSIIGSINGFNKNGCPEETVIYIHGFKNTEKNANENFEQFAKVLGSKGYKQQVVGYSWDSNTDSDDASAGFNDARKAGISNGKALAKFILDYKNKCDEMKIRIVLHSLGAAIVLSAIAELDNKNKMEIIESVDMFGPAVDNEEIQIGTPFAASANIGKSIERIVKSMYVYFSYEDDVFSSTYLLARGDQALGENSIEDYTKKPSNVTIINAQNELSADTDGDTWPNFNQSMGDNHSGYIGVINDDKITDDGAVDIAYDHWLSKSNKNYIKVMWSWLQYKGDDIGNDTWYFYFTTNGQKTDWYSKADQINNGKVYYANGTEITIKKPIPESGKIIYIKECEVGKKITITIDITAYLDETFASDDSGSNSKTLNLFCKQDTRGAVVVVDVKEGSSTANMWFNLDIVSVGNPEYNVTLFEGNKPFDGSMDIGESITAKASTNDDSIKSVKFTWIDPNNIEMKNITKPIDNAEDEYTPDKPGSWIIVVEFDDGTKIIKSIYIPFMVLNESITGAIGMVGASITVFILYLRYRYNL